MKKTAKSLKIAFIHPDLGIGGAERLILDVATALTQLGHEVIFLTNHFDKSHSFQELKTGDYHVEVYGDWLPRSLFGRFQALCAYVRMIYLTLAYIWFGLDGADKPDLYFVDLIPISAPLLKMAGMKVVYYCHHPDLLASEPGGFLKRIYRAPIDWLELKATATADLILVNSNYTAEVFRDTFPSISNEIHVLYPTIAFSYQEAVRKARPTPKSQLLPGISTDDCTVFLSVNRFHPAKRLHLAVEAMKELRRRSGAAFARTYLVVAGGFDPQSTANATYYQQLSTVISEGELGRNVFLVKSPSDGAKAELLVSCDCLIYTPVREHFGIVPLEAMAAGRPVIACDSGGPRETVEDGQSGFLCDPSPEGMAQCMMAVLADPGRAAEMGRRGRVVLGEKFSFEAFRGRLRDVLDAI